MKGRIPRIIPLPEEAIAILDSIDPTILRPPISCSLVGQPVAGSIIRRCGCCCASLGLDYDVHGFRTTFKSFGLRQPEACAGRASRRTRPLDHAIGGKVAETYRDTSLDRPSPHPERAVEFVSARAWPTPASTKCRPCRWSWITLRWRRPPLPKFDEL